MDAGSLYEKGMTDIARWLGSTSGVQVDALPQRVMTYLMSVFHAQHPPDRVSSDEVRELKRTATCIDALAQGQLPHLGDLLMQFFKALEYRHVSGSKELVDRLEIVERVPIGLTSFEERTSAAHAELLHLKLEQARQKVSKKGGAAT
jgi:hypothetical protein